MKDFLIPIFYATVAGSATLIGLALVLLSRSKVQKYSFVVVSLAAGVLLGTAFAHLLPEAYELTGETSFLWVLFGFSIFYAIESIVGFHACLEDDKHEHVLGPVAGIGIFFHSLLDGIAIAIGFEISNAIGLVTTLAVMLHELPEGIFTFSVLIHAKLPIKKAVIWTVIVALATPFGAIMTMLFFPSMPEYVLGILMGIATGSFIYIGASDLVPESHKSRSVVTGMFVLVGILLMLFVTQFIS